MNLSGFVYWTARQSVSQPVNCISLYYDEDSKVTVREAYMCSCGIDETGLAFDLMMMVRIFQSRRLDSNYSNLNGSLSGVKDVNEQK